MVNKKKTKICLVLLFGSIYRHFTLLKIVTCLLFLEITLFNTVKMYSGVF